MSGNGKGNSILPIITYSLGIVAYLLVINHYQPAIFERIINSIKMPSWQNAKHLIIPLVLSLVVLFSYSFASNNNSKNKLLNIDITLQKKSRHYFFTLIVIWLVRFLFVFSLFYYLYSEIINDRVIELIYKYPIPILKGVGMTMLVSVCSIIMGSLLGCIIAFILTNGDEMSFVKSVASSLIYILLSIPALVIILVTYYSSKFNSVFLPSFFALSINLSPFVAKIIASSINNIPKNQIDAAKAFGYNKQNILRKFTIPFVVRQSLQPLLVEYYTTIKLSSLAGYIGLIEALHTSQEINKLEQDPLSSYIILTICYIVLVAPIAIFADTLEKWYRDKKTQL